MYIIAIAWIYVTLMMSVAEATNANGTILGAIVTFILYGILPTALMVYLMGAPQRNKARKAKEAVWVTPTATELTPVEPNSGSHSTGGPQETGIPTVREKP